MKSDCAACISSRLGRKRLAARLFLLAIVVWLLWSVGRGRVLLLNGQRIAAQSAQFPRDYFVGKRNSPLLTYLVLGDSTAAGWGAGQLNRTYPHQVAQAVAARGHRVRVVNVAVGGARLSDVLKHQLGAIQRERPDLITLSAGANDATHFTSPDDYARELRAVVAALQNSTAKQILMADVPDMFQAPALPLPLAIATNWRARRLNVALTKALRGSKIRRVELYKKGKLIYRLNPNFYAADLFHPSGAGYGVWARLFIGSLE
ncbi:MAG: SGNH/GDSL hydrolase family protein [Armatimonadetes bacterium]|nr:SGNH/GDSL hydrolase family protein [Armatimonadota bacterium]